MSPLMEDLFGPPISTYTRAQAIEDGVLVDVSTVAREAGIQYPVAVTRAVWGACVTVPQGVRGQDEAGRLWDVLWMLRLVAQVAHHAGEHIAFSVHVRIDNRERMPSAVHLEAICGPGDNGEPVITVLRADED